MLPRVLYHVAASLDGRVDHIAPDLGQFYGTAQSWGEDCMLTGADTIIAAPGYAEDETADASAATGDEAASGAGRPLLAVVDTRGRVRNWRALKAMTDYWRGPVALVSRATPFEAIERLRGAGLEALVAGDERLDLRAALETLAKRYGVTRVRVDSGGLLAGALLRAGLVQEVSVLVQPALVGGELPRSIFRTPELDGSGGVIPLALRDVQKLAGDVVWLRYEVTGTA